MLATKELRYKLVQWLISAYDVPYHHIRMGNFVFMDVTIRDVEASMGIPCDGLVLPIHPNRVVRCATYTIGFLESQLVSLPIDEEFIKIFLIFTHATILALSRKLEGMHDLRDYI